MKIIMEWVNISYKLCQSIKPKSEFFMSYLHCFCNIGMKGWVLNEKFLQKKLLKVNT